MGAVTRLVRSIKQGFFLSIDMPGRLRTGLYRGEDQEQPLQDWRRQEKYGSFMDGKRGKARSASDRTSNAGGRDEEVNQNKFKIAGGRKALKVSWQVNGIRHDKQAL